MRTRLLIVVLAVTAAAWFVKNPSWVRPAALAVFAIAAAALLWGRSVGSRREPEPDGPGPRPEAAGETSKELWDALDRGEDPTAR
jgi:hypothetical protein